MATCPRCGDNLCQTHYDKVYERWCETRECLQRQNKKLQSELAAKDDELLAQAALVVELRQRAERAEAEYATLRVLHDAAIEDRDAARTELARVQPLVEAARGLSWQAKSLVEQRAMRDLATVVTALVMTLEGAEEGGDEKR